MKQIIILLMLTYSRYAFSGVDDLHKGVGVTLSSFTSLVHTSLPLSVASSAHDTDDGGFVYGFFLDEEAEVVYSLSVYPKIYAAKYPGRNLIGRWSLKRWPGELTAEIEALNRREPVTGYIGEYWKNYRYAEPLEEVLGCLVSNPLRYGDVGDGRQSLVAVLGVSDEQLDVIVFSPEHGKISLSVRVAQQDFMETENEYNENQYSPSYNMRAGRVGLRTYAKIFIGDFNDDGVKEAIVWRKRYVSRLKDDPLRGFRLDDEILSHYKLQEAEYVLQPTDKAKVEGWLAARQLTWQKGYPSKSECPGQENRLIPEMHDPLLNDPDVLQ